MAKAGSTANNDIVRIVMMQESAPRQVVFTPVRLWAIFYVMRCVALCRVAPRLCRGKPRVVWTILSLVTILKPLIIQVCHIHVLCFRK